MPFPAPHALAQAQLVELTSIDMAHLVSAAQRADTVAAIDGARYVALTSFDDESEFELKEKP